MSLESTIEKKHWIYTYLPIFIISLLFGYDSLSYLQDYIPAVILKIIYYLILFISYFIYFVKVQKNGIILYNYKSTLYVASLIFLIIYITRIVTDLYFFDVYHNVYSNEITYIIVFFNGIFLPFLFLRLINFKFVDLKILRNAMYLIILISIIITINNFFSDLVVQSVSGRLSAKEGVDSISLGHFGTSLVILSISILNTSKKYIYKIISVFSIFTGVIIMGLANSRGPILALLVCLIIYIWVKKKYSILMFLIFLMIIISSYIDSISEFFLSYGSDTVQRLLFTIENFNGQEDITSGRDNIYTEAFNVFSESPIFGDHFLLQKGAFKGEYPHNFILEALISNGLIGVILYLFIIITTFYQACKLMMLSREYTFISLLFVQYLVFSMTSRSMINLPVFWLLLFLVNSIYYQLKLNHENPHTY